MGHPGARMLLVAAIASGQGKTTVTAALARGLVRMGQRVRVFKCGPDFIDPMLLERACGRRCTRSTCGWSDWKLCRAAWRAPRARRTSC
jgi:hypothetical protein